MAHIIRAQTVPGGAGTNQGVLHTPNREIDVQYLEEKDRTQYLSGSGSLSQVVRAYNRKISRRIVVFAQKEAFDRYQDTSFFPPRFRYVIDDDLNGTFGLSYRDDDITNAGDASYDTWSTFKIKHTYQGDDYLTIDYHWSQISVLVRQSKSRQFILFVDCPSSVTKKIIDKTSRRHKELHDVDNPFVWHSLLAEELRDVYDKAVWEMRHIIRRRERGRGDTWFKPGTIKPGITSSMTGLGDKSNSTPLYKPDITYLKEIARHLIHINEAFLVAGDTLESMMHHHANFFRENTRTRPTETSEAREKTYSRIQERLYITNKELRAIKFRAATLSERLDNEIDLYNHQLSIFIAESTRHDNARMMALTLVGVLYLPGSFISGIFGSNFFNYSPGSDGRDWNMSSKFWIYWAVTIPLTIVTFLGLIVPGHMIELWRRAVGTVKSSRAWGLVSSAASSPRQARPHTEGKMPQV